MAAAQERERNASEQYRQLSSKTATLESKISSNNKIKSNVEAQLEQSTKHLENLKEELEKNKVLNETVKSTLGKEISELKNETETGRIGKCQKMLKSLIYSLILLICRASLVHWY